MICCDVASTCALHCRPVISVVLTIVALGLLIAAHEAGHLALARLLGMRVETYSLGFGPRIAGFRHGETDYRLSAFPLGGYCKIAGFSPDEPAAQDPADTGSYANKPAWKRFLVIAAGPGVNYLVLPHHRPALRDAGIRGSLDDADRRVARRSGGARRPADGRSDRLGGRSAHPRLRRSVARAAPSGSARRAHHRIRAQRDAAHRPGTPR